MQYLVLYAITHQRLNFDDVDRRSCFFQPSTPVDLPHTSGTLNMETDRPQIIVWQDKILRCYNFC